MAFSQAVRCSGLTLGIVPLERRLFADILKVGLPTAINALQSNLCVILVTGAVGLFGTAALAGYGIAARLDYVMIPILFGLSSAVLAMPARAPGRAASPGSVPGSAPA